jgi:hypothetical protein
MKIISDNSFRIYRRRRRVPVVGVAPNAAQSPSAPIILTARQSILAALRRVRRPLNVATLERNIPCALFCTSFCIRRRGFVLESHWREAPSETQKPTIRECDRRRNGFVLEQTENRQGIGGRGKRPAHVWRQFDAGLARETRGEYPLRTV